MLSNKPLKAENYSRVLLELDLYGKVSLGNQSLYISQQSLFTVSQKIRSALRYFYPAAHTHAHTSLWVPKTPACAA